MEIALVLPFVVVLLLLVIQIGFLVRDFVRVAHASREAARAAAVDPSGDRSRDVVRHLLGDALVHLEPASEVGDPVRALVVYRARTDVPIVGALLPDVTIEDATTMRAERT